MSLTTGIVRKLRRYSQWFWSSYVVCLRTAGLPEGVLVETLVTVTDMFLVSSSLFKGCFLHYFWTTRRSFLPRATCNTTFKCQRLCSSSPTAKVCLCRPRPDKSDVYLLLKELDEKVVKLPFPALGTGFKVPTQPRVDYTGITSWSCPLQMDFSVRVAPLAIVPSWVLASLDLETACPSRSCRFEVLFHVPASGHQTYWCRTPSRYKSQFHDHRFG